MTTNTMKKNGKKLLAVMMMAGVLGMTSLPLGAPKAEAYLVSSQQERVFGGWMTEKYEKKHGTYASDYVTDIMDNIVAHNRDKLNYEDGSHARYLFPVKVSRENQENAFTFAGGQIYITEKMINRFQEGDASYNPANLYAASSTANVLGHEAGHWANCDMLKTMDQFLTQNFIYQFIPIPSNAVFLANLGANAMTILSTRQLSFDSEAGADASGMEFIKNVPEYSVGSPIPMYRRWMSWGEATGFDNYMKPHSTDELRLDRVREAIRKDSDGHVLVSRDGELNYDTRDFLGTGYVPKNSYASAAARTTYLAGQIATSIERGRWAPENLALAKESTYLKGGRANKTVMYVKDSSGRPFKYLGNFDIPYEKATSGNTSKMTQSEKQEYETIQAIRKLTLGVHGPSLKAKLRKLEKQNKTNG